MKVSPYVARPTRTLAQALIDGLGPGTTAIPLNDGWTAHANLTNNLTGFAVRQVHVHLNGRIRVYDAAGKLEQEYEG